jgi:hypothetical protein
VDHLRQLESGRRIALERLRRELAEHDRSDARETPFSIAIREQLAQEESVDGSASGSAA